jgi:hypothetical protein
VLPPSEAAFSSGARAYRCVATQIGHQPERHNRKLEPTAFGT